MIETTVDLPYPPSVNRIWQLTGRGPNVTLSGQYRNWLDAANRLCIANGVGRAKKITGPFEATIIVAIDGRRKHIDLDNGAKAVLDYAKRAELITDDRFLQRLTIQWAHPREAPEGCRLTLRTCPSVADAVRGAEHPFVAPGQRL